LAGKELSGDALDSLLVELLRVRIVALRKIADERQADLSGIPREPLLSERLAVPAAATPPPAPSMKLSELIRKHLADGAAAGTWRPRTRTLVEHALRELVEIIGDVPIASITKETVRQYHAALQQLPGRRSEKLLPATVGKRLTHFAAVLNFAVREDLIAKSPLSGMKLTGGKKNASERRKSFSDEDLRAIFCGDYRRATRRHPAWFWCPLLALHTGARLGELAQLLVADIVTVDGVDCIKISDGGRGPALEERGEPPPRPCA